MVEPLRQRAAQRGRALRPGADRLLAEIAPAVIVHRLLIAGEPCDEPFLKHLVDDALVPLLEPREKARAR